MGMSSDNTDTPEKGEVVKVSESSDAANNIKGDDNEIRVNSVDNHIVDKNLHPSSCDEEKDSGVAEKRNDEKHDVSEQSSLPPQQTVPASAIEKFVAQLERIQGEHDIELGDLVKRHMIEIGKVQSELAETKKANLAIAATAAAAAANIPSNKDSHRVASHDKCLAKQRQLERVFNIQLDEKEEERVEALRKVEEMTLKVNVAMKDVDKMKTQVLKSDVRILEVDKKEKEIRDLKNLLEKSRAEASTLQEDHSALKARVKMVATELKERRAECRSLKTLSDECSLKLG